MKSRAVTLCIVLGMIGESAVNACVDTIVKINVTGHNSTDVAINAPPVTHLFASERCFAREQLESNVLFESHYARATVCLIMY